MINPAYLFETLDRCTNFVREYARCANPFPFQCIPPHPTQRLTARSVSTRFRHARNVCLGRKSMVGRWQLRVADGGVVVDVCVVDR
jgi:hypothetical protein